MSLEKNFFIDQRISDKKKVKGYNSLIHDNHWKYKSKGWNRNWNIYPITEPYFSPFNAISLFEVENLDFLSNFPFVLVRDGLFSLMHFFLKHKEPSEELSTKLIVHESFAPTIPPSWRDNIWYFNYYISSNTFHYKKSPKKFLLLKGYLTHSFASLEYFEAKLKEVKSFLERNQRELYVYLPLAHDSFLEKHYSEKDYLHDMLKILYSILDREQVNIVHTYNLEKMNYYKEGTFIDTNHLFKCYCDDYFNYFLISNGCLPEPEFIKEHPLNENDPETVFYRISPNHGIIIHDQHPPNFSCLRGEIELGNRFVKTKNTSRPIVDASFFYHLNRIFEKHIPPFQWLGDPSIKNENLSQRSQAEKRTR